MLITHAEVTADFFGVLVLLSLFVLPVAIVVCLLVKRWMRFVRSLALYALLFGLCVGCMLLAPSEFLNWWWD